MSFIRRAIALSAVVLLSTQAHAQRPHVARALPGYTCKMLNITVEQAMDPTFHMPYYSFDEAIFPNGGKVWIEASVLKDYHSLGDPTAKCVPVVMSNGRQGFDYPH
jgi:hypothetical protein